MTRHIYKVFDEQEDRNEYWNSVSPDKMDYQLFARGARRFVREEPPRILNEMYKEALDRGDRPTICDVGCAYAPQALLLDSRFKYLGVDPAVKIIEANRETYAGHENIEFLPITSSQAFEQFGEKSFDIVTILSIFGTFSEEEGLRLMEEAGRMARDTLIITTLHPERNPSEGKKISRSTPHWPHDLVAIGDRLGFKSEVIETKTTHYGVLFVR